MPDYVDPRKRDPRFPDRPTHEDYVDLSELVQRIDAMAEDGVPLSVITGVDMGSLQYLMTSRIGLAIQRLGRGNIDPRDSMLQALYLDAFTLGRYYERRRGGEE